MDKPMKKIVIVYIWIVGLLFAQTSYEILECHKIENAFTQAKYLIDKYHNYKGAYVLVRQYTGGYGRLDCYKKYQQDVIDILYHNKQLYALKDWLRTDKQLSANIDHTMLFKYIADLYKEQHNKSQAIIYYKRYLAKSKIQDKNIIAYIKGEETKNYHSKFAKVLNPTSKLPKGKFKNIFYNYKTKQIIKTTYMSTFGLSALPKVYGNKVDEVVSYHAGLFEFKKDINCSVALELGYRDRVRIIIDNHLIIDNKKDRFSLKKSFLIQQGLHKIEVEYMPRGGNYRFAFEVKPNVHYYTQRELQKIFAKQDLQVWLVETEPRYYSRDPLIELPIGVYDIEATIEEMKKPSVLYISSTGGKINWHFKNAKYIKAIVVDKKRDFLDDFDIDVPVYYAKNLSHFTLNRQEKCRCNKNAQVVCFNTIDKGLERLKEIFGSYPVNISFGIKHEVTFPFLRITSQDIKDFDSKIKQYKQKCSTVPQLAPQKWAFFKKGAKR